MVIVHLISEWTLELSESLFNSCSLFVKLPFCCCCFFDKLEKEKLREKKGQETKKKKGKCSDSLKFQFTAQTCAVPAFPTSQHL